MKKITFLLLFFISFITLNAQDISKDEMKKSLEEGIVSFVKSVKSTIGAELGANYEAFKTQLIGASNLGSIPEEGNNLLALTYQLIKDNADDNEIIERGFNTFKLAAAYVLKNETNNPNPSNTLKNGQKALFGGNESSFKGFDPLEDGKVAAGGGCGSYRECAHWYSIGCHLHNAGVWICQHAYLLMGLYYAIQLIGML
jgi:hypothetical protein